MLLRSIGEKYEGVYKKLLNKIQNNRPEDVSQFIQDNNFDVVETLEKIAIIPINYTTKIVLKKTDGSVKQENDVNLRYFPSIYAAVLNEEHSLEMVMWLHKYAATPIEVPLVAYYVDDSHEYFEAHEKAKEFSNYDYVTHAITNNKPLLLNYLLSFERVKENGFIDFDDVLNVDQSIDQSVAIKTQKESYFNEQKLLFENKNYQALMDAMDNSTLVYSVLELVKDNAFTKFCQENGSDFVKLYMGNAEYELGFTKYDDINVDDPNLKFECRRPITSHTKNQETPLKVNSMFNLSNTAYIVGGVAVAGLAAYYLSNLRK